MIYIRYRDDPIADAGVAEFPDEEYLEALVELERFQDNWAEVWMYLETESKTQGIADDWVILFDNTDPL